MKILLTGQPKSGKTTLLIKLVEPLEPKQGLVAVEVLEAGARVGFDLQDEAGRRAVLSRVGTVTSYPVGRYFVDVEAFDDFIGSLPAPKPDQLLYIDEIGQMQLYSKRFQHLVERYLSGDHDFIGTISAVYNHPFIEKLRLREDILLCTITAANRKFVEEVLSVALLHRHIFDSLTLSQQGATLDLARGYLEHSHYTSLKKLFKNALSYVSESRVRHTAPHEYAVSGNTAQHKVQERDGRFICDCDFFKGRAAFAGNTGECSHIQAVLLSR